ncbi:GNAT family N-acetyltransferase [Clostridium sp. AL.422]|uniref:GNAT family N-acetyltransferase n=1 Tax=Clostridium TaxID=1485 RepID=UPI00293DFC13|nr:MULTISPECIES: GNAT family N-acetyltransferase [unclassified Clostridium]MDV4150180.1 GNAT family N-acetyltransferase [Clostridium sp. AL.422]
MIEIKPFDQNDMLGICTLIRLELGYNVSIEDFQNRIMQMQKEGNYFIFVALENNQVVGFIGIQISLAFEIPGRIMRIIALAVSEKYQKKGIGRRLIQEAEEYGKTKQVTTILLNSGLSRKGAHQFYEKQGFYKKGYSFCKK